MSQGECAYEQVRILGKVEFASCLWVVAIETWAILNSLEYFSDGKKNMAIDSLLQTLFNQDPRGFAKFGSNTGSIHLDNIYRKPSYDTYSMIQAYLGPRAIVLGPLFPIPSDISLAAVKSRLEALEIQALHKALLSIYSSLSLSACQVVQQISDELLHPDFQFSALDHGGIDYPTFPAHTVVEV